MNRGEYTTEIYDLLYFCEQYSVGKKVLDCGAGGSYPKLAFFAKKGYELHGIDSDKESILQAEEFARNQQIQIDITEADFREIPYPDASFDVVFSYNSIFHMRKVEIRKAVKEIIRVLKPDGIGFINFIGSEDEIHKTDKEDGPGEFISSGDDYEVIHTSVSEEECESMLQGVKILEKQRKFINRLNTDYPDTYGFLDYFFQKE